MEEIRLLTKEDIDVRVAQTNLYNKDGQQIVKVNLLLYKDARVDMKILDELFTPMGWKRTHKLIGDRLYCCVEVFDKTTGAWIGKEDVGTESNTEAEKGQASDSFKRACVNWGIGRELYTAPKITVELREGEFTRDQNSKIKVWATFSVKSIEYDPVARTISSLEIQDKNGDTRFSMKNPVQQIHPVQQSQPSQAVKARRAAKKVSQTPVVSAPAEPAPTEPAPAEPAPKLPYAPVDNETYQKMVEAEACGILCPSGKTVKARWVEITHADVNEILLFDQDVRDWKRQNSFQ